MAVQNEHPDFEPINSFALNDVVYDEDWLEDEDYEVHFSARYAGASADGTIYFRVRRGVQRVTTHADTRPLGMPNLAFNAPSIPIFWEVRAPLLQRRNNRMFGGVAWRFGPGSEDVKLQYYALSDDGILIEVKKPADVTERPVGFRASMSRESE